MKTFFKNIIYLFAFVFISSFSKKEAKVLVFSKTMGYHHESIAAGIKAIEKLGKENHFIVDTTTDGAAFTEQNLKQYKAVIFLSTTGTVLNAEQKQAFQQYIEYGGGFVGVHAATDTEYGWPWYNRLVGAYFKSHPAQQNAELNIVDKKFIATKHLPSTWNRWDEWYNFKDTHWDSVHVLITINEKSYKGGENGDYHPMSWYHSFDGGRAFYTALGHTDASYSDPLFLGHLLGGILYAMHQKQ
ncbi:MAG: ThuA domain-containing protein [Hydrotalea sp. AMD]|uniref:ThuA domain-containing protein n=2 Tax=Chitinophagaceae TaxID=563835 RepID=UPI0009458694|nr:MULTISPECIES: ThuA domain-containing protein [Hydrotalea]RWZ90681.1 MAG: ThuA domain-containing protein [Hydrotalea sp. AMD]